MADDGLVSRSPVRSMSRIQFSTRQALLIALASVAACSTLSCSVLIDTKTKQCDSDADCVALGSSTATCSADRVCVVPSGLLPAEGCEEPEESSNRTVTLS